MKLMTLWAGNTQAAQPPVYNAPKLMYQWAGMMGLQTGFPLKKGEKKWQIAAMQRGLNYLGNNLGVDGVWGPGTMAALQKVWNVTYVIESLDERAYNSLFNNMIIQAKAVPTAPEARLKTIVENGDAAWRELVMAYAAIETSSSKLGGEVMLLKGQVDILAKKSNALQDKILKTVLGYVPNQTAANAYQNHVPGNFSTSSNSGEGGPRLSNDGRYKAPYKIASSNIDEGYSADFILKQGLIATAISKRNAISVFELNSQFPANAVVQLKVEAEAIKLFILNYTHTTQEQVESNSAPPKSDLAVKAGQVLDAAGNMVSPVVNAAGNAVDEVKAKSETAAQIQELMDVMFSILPVALVFFGIKAASNLYKGVDKNTKF